MGVTPELIEDHARPVWFDAFLVGVAALVVFAVTAQYHDSLNNDTQSTAIAAWQLATHGNATLTAFQGHVAWLYHAGTRDVTNRLPGTIFWATPFYAALGRGDAPAVYPGALAAAVASAIAVGLTFAVCCRVVARSVALGAAMLLAFATGTWTVSADQLWTHGPAQAAVLLTVLCCAQHRWLAAGFAAGFAILIRPHLGIVAVVLGVVGAIHERRWRPLLISVGSAIGLGILLIYNHDLWNTWSVFGGYRDLAPTSRHVVADFAEGIVGIFVSPERGLLVMTPALLVLLPGLRAAWRTAPSWVRSAALAGLCYLAEQLWVSRFSGGNGFYSYRTTLEGLTLTVPLLALAWREWTAVTQVRRTMFAALAAVSVALHAFGAVVNWVPGGTEHSPWTTYLPVDLAHHVGAAQASVWLAVSVVVMIAVTIATWRRGELAAEHSGEAGSSGVPRPVGLDPSSSR